MNNTVTHLRMDYITATHCGSKGLGTRLNPPPIILFATNMADSSDKPRAKPNPKAGNIVTFLLQVELFVVGVMLAIFYGGYYYCDYIPVPASLDLATRMAFTVRCVFPAVVVLAFFIASVGSKRVSTGALNPLASKEHLVQMEKNVLINTVEQFLVFAVCSLTLATYLETPTEMKLIPLYTTAFIAGRVLFRIGYGIRPEYRAFGMHLNFASSGFVLAKVIYLQLTRGVAGGI